MTVIKTLWASIQGDPKFMQRLNGILTIFWLAMIPVSILTGWINSVAYVSALSLWALVSGHWSAWQAARVEVRQDEDANVAEVLAVVIDIQDYLRKRDANYDPSRSESGGRERAVPPGSRGAS
jgi:hypothetical protein